METGAPLTPPLSHRTISFLSANSLVAVGKNQKNSSLVSFLSSLIGSRPEYDSPTSQSISGRFLPSTANSIVSQSATKNSTHVTNKNHRLGKAATTAQLVVAMGHILPPCLVYTYSRWRWSGTAGAGRRRSWPGRRPRGVARWASGSWGAGAGREGRRHSPCGRRWRGPRGRGGQ